MRTWVHSGLLRGLVVGIAIGILSPPIPEASAERPSLNKLNAELNALRAELKRQTLRVFDGNGTDIALFVDFSGSDPGVHILGYFDSVGALLRLGQNGTLATDGTAVRFSDPGCEGTPYVREIWAGYVVENRPDDRLFVAQALPGSLLTTESTLSGECTNLVEGPNEPLVPATEITLGDIGLPPVLVPPLYVAPEAD